VASDLLREFVVYGIAFGPFYNVDDDTFNSGIHIIFTDKTTFWTFLRGMHSISTN